MDLVAAYADQISQLLPRGRAWNTSNGTVLRKLCEGIAEEFARIHARAAALASERIPLTAVELIAEWERVTGSVSLTSDSIADRQRRVTAQLNVTGRQDAPFYLSIISGYGYSASIQSFTPFFAGGVCETPCYDDSWRFVAKFKIASPVSLPVVESTLNALKPAHITYLFEYNVTKFTAGSKAGQALTAF